MLCANRMPIFTSNLSIHRFCYLGGEWSQNQSPIGSGAWIPAYISNNNHLCPVEVVFICVKSSSARENITEI